MVEHGEDFEAGIRELTKLVHGSDDRPALGEAPEFIRGLTESVGGLTREATSVGSYLLGRADVDDGTIPQVDGDEIQRDKLTPQEINDAVDELEGNGLVRTMKWIGRLPFDFGVAMLTYLIFLHFKEPLPYDPEEDIQIVLDAMAAIEQCEPADLRNDRSVRLPPRPGRRLPGGLRARQGDQTPQDRTVLVRFGVRHKPDPPGRSGRRRGGKEPAAIACSWGHCHARARG